jgi:DNA-binding NarL/FixJ family response regulator
VFEDKFRTGNDETAERPASKATPAAGASKGVLIIIDGRTLYRECFGQTVSRCLEIEMAAYSTVEEWSSAADGPKPSIVLVSIGSMTEPCAQRIVSEAVLAAPDAPIVVLADRGDLTDVQRALELGAKGFIVSDMDVNVTVRALQFVRVGGEYVPTTCLRCVSAQQAPDEPAVTCDLFTPREMAVVRAIRQGKLNKTIAYELNMCESTVKVHVRRIMKKLHARNRTEVAIKGLSLAAVAN